MSMEQIEIAGEWFELETEVAELVERLKSALQKIQSSYPGSTLDYADYSAAAHRIATETLRVTASSLNGSDLADQQTRIAWQDEMRRDACGEIHE